MISCSGLLPHVVVVMVVVVVVVVVVVGLAVAEFGRLSLAIVGPKVFSDLLFVVFHASFMICYVLKTLAAQTCSINLVTVICCVDGAVGEFPPLHLLARGNMWS